MFLGCNRCFGSRLSHHSENRTWVHWFSTLRMLHKLCHRVRSKVQSVNKKIVTEIIAMALFKQLLLSCSNRLSKEEHLFLVAIYGTIICCIIFFKGWIVEKSNKKHKQTTSIYTFISPEFLFSRDMTNSLRLIFDFKGRYYDEASR